MSASLVGSEMCIRDRGTNIKVVSRSAQFKLGAQSLWRASAESPQSLQRAVSYTHLTLPTICSV
eukprot:5166507-Alexandrium_andersonii.AAC.1